MSPFHLKFVFSEVVEIGYIYIDIDISPPIFYTYIDTDTYFLLYG